MALWLLNHLSTLALTLLIVGGCVLATLAGSLLVRRRLPRLAEGEHNETVGLVLGMFGAIYGIILAFVIVTLWTQMENTQAVVATEATDAAIIVRDVAAFPDEPETRVKKAVGHYVHHVVEAQWPEMRDGMKTLSSGEQLQGVYNALQSYEPVTEMQKIYYAEAADSLDDMASQRRARLTMAGQELPLLLQVLVFGGAVVILPLTFLYGTRSRKMQLLFVAAVAGLIGFSLLLVVVLDRPFAGDLSVSPELFKQGKLEQFWNPAQQS
ncbi:DUF4239 domain-containing protein [Streptomyces sp. NPDC091371]|uniref:bestrophin-like domain n=1 Tax=Streptomyces sp. NPDC091371 TaxID=3155303 RepID=UPI003449A565